MKKSLRLLLGKIIVLVIGIGMLLWFFFDGLKFEILGGALGVMVAAVGADLVTSILLLREEKIKLESDNFLYDKTFYRKTLPIGGGETHIWYDAVKHDGSAYVVRDNPHKHFVLDSVVQNNFGAIMKAHRASFVVNPMMIRLDDYRREADGTITLFTSRTAFYNDLVTNRAMDYKFNGEMSVREIFESGRYLSPLNESKMSNHIGFGAFIFYGDSMIVTHRGGNATLSKNQFTAALAFGFLEDDLRKVHESSDDDGRPKASERFPVLTTDDLMVGILLVRMAGLLKLSLRKVRQLYAQNKIHIHLLGFGQLVYTGGKPQFYFAIVIDRDVELCCKGSQNRFRTGKELDFNKDVVFADGITLVKNGEHVLRLRKHGSGETVKAEAEKSFFINYWHLLEMPRIEGVPDWVYECKAL